MVEISEESPLLASVGLAAPELYRDGKSMGLRILVMRASSIGIVPEKGVVPRVNRVLSTVRGKISADKFEVAHVGSQVLGLRSDPHDENTVDELIGDG